MAHRAQMWMVLTTAIISLAFARPARAQEDENADDPTRGVARISVVQGEVSVKRGDSGEVVAAAINAPLMAQDHVQTADGSRSEIELDSANLVRLAPDTDLGIADLQRGRFQIQLGAGTVTYRVLRDSRADAEIDTPGISVRPSGQSAIRISVTQDGTTEVTVRSGKANIYSPRGSQALRSGQSMLVRGSSSDPEFQLESEVAPDQFDDWCLNRDQQLLRSRSYQYVSSDIDGADDLDGYGTWVPSSYGNVWAPRVEPGWAPYHSGRWVWEDYYGWTWVDYSPWGWAPFHYGRWFLNAGYGWCWWPGAIRQRYFWRPALVGFFGFGGGFGVSVGFGFGNVGWVPLAPYEPWHAWYGRGWYGGPRWNSYGNRTIINNTNIYNMYRNARVNNGVAYTGVNNFGRGSQSFYAASGAQFREASLVRGALPVAPGRSSLAFGNQTVTGNHFASSQNQQFFVHQQPSSEQRIPFTEQQRQMAQFQERTTGIRPNFNQSANNYSQAYGSGPQSNSYSSSPNTFQRGGSVPAARQQTNSRSYNNVPSAGGDSAWHRFGDSGAGSSYRPAERPAVPANPALNQGNAWHSFGSPWDSSRQASPSSNQGSYSSPSKSNRPAESPRYQQPMRMNPPIVNERPSYSAPRQSESHYSAPRYSSPSGNSGHSGSSSHSDAGRSKDGGSGGHRH